jgi:hypothetical protein
MLKEEAAWPWGVVQTRAFAPPDSFAKLGHCLVTVTFYASAAMIVLRRVHHALSSRTGLPFPLVALVVALYFHVASKDESCGRHPEKLYGRHAPSGMSRSAPGIKESRRLTQFPPVVRSLETRLQWLNAPERFFENT